jgi:beta-aspartyl-peptidase (threonine type)
MARAVVSGWQSLSRGAIEAVAKTVEVLEDDPEFNAGRGAVLDQFGLPHLDASIGSDGRYGAIGSSLAAHSAIRSALAVRDRSPHALLVGEYCDSWLVSQGLASSPLRRITPEQRQAWESWKSGQALDSLGTVGAVALDSHGRLAAGTSTGGLRGKAGGRVGDSAIPGSGTWADRQCAISMTGDGDRILERSSAARIALGIGRGYDPSSVIDEELRSLEAIEAPAGVIVLLADGRSFIRRNCQMMNGAWIDRRGGVVPRANDPKLRVPA